MLSPLLQQMRARAVYSTFGGVIAFSNDTGKGPVKFVSFCVLDRMYHVKFKDETPKAKIQEYGEQICKANYDYNGSSCQLGLGDTLRSFWYPGNIDLDDLAPILELVPELEIDWLQSKVNDLKIISGLEPNEPPFLDNFENRKHSIWIDGALERDAWFSHCTVSMKGGSLYFSSDIPSSKLREIKIELRKDANIELEKINDEELSLLIRWKEPCRTAEETYNRITEVLAKFPEVLSGLISKCSRRR